MPILMTIASIIMVISSIVLIVVVLLQSGKQAGISGVISGGADTFLAKNKARSLDSRLARWTKWIAFIFMLLSFALAIMSTVLL